MFLTVEQVAEQFHTTPEHIRKKAAAYKPTTAEQIKGADRDYARFRIMPLDQLRGLPRVSNQMESGVYFLWRGPMLVYIGQSQSVGFRVGQHRYFRKQFTHATFAAYGNRLIDFEGRYIRHYEPLLNIKGIR